MFSRIFYLVVTVCVVNASVLTVNVFDDDSNSEVASNPKDCNPQACHQLCRRLKFPGGTCVNGRCKCDNFLNVEDEIAEEEYLDLEDMVSQKDDPEAEVATNARRCKDKACNWLCRALNNTSGACVDGRCKCTKSVVAEDGLEAEVAANPSRCRDKACDSVCRALNNTSGACVDGRCKCTKSLVAEGPEAEDPASIRRCSISACSSICKSENKRGICYKGRCKCIISEDLEDSITGKRCKPEACHNRCRGFGFREGVCTGNRCSCITFVSTSEDAMKDLEESISVDDDFLTHKFFNTEGIDAHSEESPESESSEDQNERGCNPKVCDQLCRTMKFKGRACVNGRCKCDNFFGTEDAIDEYSELDTRRGCRITKCNRTCTRLGYDSAACVNRRCKCYNKTLTQDEVSETSLPVSELSEDQNERGCNPKACDQLCRRLKFKGGACVNGRCKCDNFFGTEDVIDEYSELDTRRGCRITKCNRTCTRLGYDSAACVNRRCKCYNKTQTQDEVSETSLPVSELSDDQNERGCNPKACDQLCRRLKFKGGACVNGRCKCDNFFGTEDAVDEYSELDTRRGCRITKCNRTCTRLGYDSATCVNRRCKCYNKTQDASPLNDVISDENGKSNEILRTNEDKLTDASPRACNTSTCSNLCRRRGYAGGRCRFDKCQCFQ